MLTQGVDVWVNTPRRPYEASGTSGMKAALNGVPSLSVLDGWWIEGCAEDAHRLGHRRRRRRRRRSLQPLRQAGRQDRPALRPPQRLGAHAAALHRHQRHLLQHPSHAQPVLPQRLLSPKADPAGNIRQRPAAAPPMFRCPSLYWSPPSSLLTKTRKKPANVYSCNTIASFVTDTVAFSRAVIRINRHRYFCSQKVGRISGLLLFHHASEVGPGFSPGIYSSEVWGFRGMTSYPTLCIRFWRQA